MTGRIQGRRKIDKTREKEKHGWGASLITGKRGSKCRGERHDLEAPRPQEGAECTATDSEMGEWGSGSWQVLLLALGCFCLLWGFGGGGSKAGRKVICTEVGCGISIRA